MHPLTPADRARLLATIVAEVTTAVNQFCDEFAAAPDAPFPVLEAAAVRASHAVGAPLLAAVFEAQRAQVEATPPRCACGRPRHYKATSPRTLLTRLGPCTWQRGYYYCSRCDQGTFPLDEAFAVPAGHYSPGVQRILSLLGASEPFASAARDWLEVAEHAVSGRQVGRLTEAAGQRWEAQLAAERAAALAGTPAAAPAPRPPGPGIWTVGLDAAKVDFRDGWHEVKVGVVGWAVPSERPGRTPEESRPGAQITESSYVVQVGTLEAAGERLYAEAVRRGIDPSEERVVCVADGAVGIWEVFKTHFPWRVEVLDWYHAVEHLWAAGNGVFGEGTAEARAWVEARKAELWEGRVEAVRAALREQAERGDGRGGAAADEEHYFETNAPRMNYAAARAAGYPLGSGVVESGCKRVIGARAKGAGMRWSGEGAQAVLSLRAAALSGRWGEVWAAQRAMPLAA